MESEQSGQQKEVIIEIRGTATYSDKSEFDQVKAFDEFVTELFIKHQDALQREFKAVGELSYEQEAENSNEMIDPYLSNLRFDTVTKNVR